MKFQNILLTKLHHILLFQEGHLFVKKLEHFNSFESYDFFDTNIIMSENLKHLKI